ncbi:MAG: hypothetical protein HC882_02460 [Acidobacteria bacterium]|nr:hypothetical protein [Acidobacteriota bacterium]
MFVAADRKASRTTSYERSSGRGGFAYEIVRPSTPAAAVRDLAAGRVDLVALAGSGPQPPQTPVAWTDPIGYERPVAVGRFAHEIRSIDDLVGREIAVRRHSALEAVAMAWRDRLGAR